MDKTLVIYEHEYDLLSIRGVITEDKLEEYTELHIKKTLARATIKFEVTKVETINDFVSIVVIYDAYTTNWNGTEKFFPRKKGNIGFYFYKVDPEQVNKCLIG